MTMTDNYDIDKVFNYELSEEETQAFVPEFTRLDSADHGINVAEAFSMRKAVLGEAMAAVLTDRETSYGTPESNFGLIADLWTAYKGVDFRPDEVAAMMILLKLARHKSAKKFDNPVDIAGYAACMAEVDFRDTV